MVSRGKSGSSPRFHIAPLSGFGMLVAFGCRGYDLPSLMAIGGKRQCPSIQLLDCQVIVGQSLVVCGSCLSRMLTNATDHQMCPMSFHIGASMRPQTPYGLSSLGGRFSQEFRDGPPTPIARMGGIPKPPRGPPQSCKGNGHILSTKFAKGSFVIAFVADGWPNEGRPERPWRQRKIRLRVSSEPTAHQPSFECFVVGVRNLPKLGNYVRNTRRPLLSNSSGFGWPQLCLTVPRTCNCHCQPQLVCNGWGIPKGVASLLGQFNRRVFVSGDQVHLVKRFWRGVRALVAVGAKGGIRNTGPRFRRAYY